MFITVVGTKREFPKYASKVVLPIRWVWLPGQVHAPNFSQNSVNTPNIINWVVLQYLMWWFLLFLLLKLVFSQTSCYVSTIRNRSCS